MTASFLQKHVEYIALFTYLHIGRSGFCGCLCICFKKIRGIPSDPYGGFYPDRDPFGMAFVQGE